MDAEDGLGAGDRDDGSKRRRRLGAIVVTGAGRGFCAGADIGSQFASKLNGEPEAEREPFTAAANWVAECRSAKPLVAAVNGAAIGVGLTMILPFDQIVASTSAKLSMRFVRLGLVPELASTTFLVARCGWGAASRLMLSGETILGDEAERLGLVDRAVPPGDVVDAAFAQANLFAENPTPQLRMVKELLTRNTHEVDLDLVQRRELAALGKASKTPEHREAVTAFLEKRPPKFRAD